MGTNKLVSKLDDFFGLSKKEQKKKQDKLLNIISKLEKKKASVMEKMAEESERDETSERFHELESELKVIAKLLRKARKHSHEEVQKHKDNDQDQGQGQEESPEKVDDKDDHST